MRGLIGSAPLTVLSIGLVLAGCATTGRGFDPATTAARSQVPAVRLSPASLGHSLALRQRLEFRFGAVHRQFDALVEADGRSVRLDIQQLGQSALRLEWQDGRLSEARAEWLPAEVDSGRVLNDLQLAFWPGAAVSEALPAGWSLVEHDGVRRILHGGSVVTEIHYPAADRVELEQRLDGYSLTIESISLEGVTQ